MAAPLPLGERGSGVEVSVSEVGGKSGSLPDRGNASKHCPVKESRHGPDPRTTSPSPAPLRGPPRRLPGRGPTPRRTARQQARCPALGQDRVRGPRRRPPARRHRLAGRSPGAEKRWYQGSSMTCPHCHEDARCKGFRCRTALTLLGVLRFPRHYYHCRHCGQGVSPLDQSLGLSAADLTPAADEVVCLAGVQDSFATAAVKVLTRLSGLRVSESTAERATEATGRRVAQAQAACRTFGPPTPWSCTRTPTVRRWRMSPWTLPASASKGSVARRRTGAWPTWA